MGTKRTVMLSLILLLPGLSLLVLGSRWLVDGGASVAKRFRISPLVIGLTITAFGTSMPELTINVLASLRGSSEISIGNIVGANLANILLILGVTSTLVNLSIQRGTVWREIPFAWLAATSLLVATSVSFVDAERTVLLGRGVGAVFLALFATFLGYIAYVVRTTHVHERVYRSIRDQTLPRATLSIVAGVLALFGGGRIVVSSIVELAKSAGLSEFLISATLVAIGTTLPELVTSVTAALRRQTDIAVGNIIGSNIFNILLILGISSSIRPLAFPAYVAFDVFLLLLATTLLFLFMFIGRKHRLTGKQGVVFLLLYGAYTLFVVVRG